MSALHRWGVGATYEREIIYRFGGEGGGICDSDLCVYSTPYSMTVESQKNCDQCTLVSHLVGFYLFTRFWTAQEGGEKSHILYFHTTLFIHAGIHMPS